MWIFLFKSDFMVFLPQRNPWVTSHCSRWFDPQYFISLIRKQLEVLVRHWLFVNFSRAEELVMWGGEVVRRWFLGGRGSCDERADKRAGIKGQGWKSCGERAACCGKECQEREVWERWGCSSWMEELLWAVTLLWGVLRPFNLVTLLCKLGAFTPVVCWDYISVPAVFVAWIHSPAGRGSSGSVGPWETLLQWFNWLTMVRNLNAHVWTLL